MSIEFRHSAEKKSARNWAWSVWLEGSDAELDQVDSVVYQLHSTFRNPVREVSDRQSNFRLDSSGWGQFMIYITLRYRDGRDEPRKHWLSFGDSAPNKELESILGHDFGSRAPKVFLSYSVADTNTAEAIRKNLEQKGILVLDATSDAGGASLSDSIESLIDQADFGISIESDISSSWADQERRQMQEKNLPVLIVSPDSPTDLTETHLKIQPLEVNAEIEFASLIDPHIKFESS